MNETLKNLTHEDEISKVNTRFYAFQGAWGSHQAVLVDTETGLEYEVMTRTHLSAPWVSTPVSDESLVALAKRVERGISGGKPAGSFSRQCFHHGLGYKPVAA